MAVPSLPAQGSPNWFAWAQGVHDSAVEVSTGRLTDTALRAAFGRPRRTLPAPWAGSRNQTVHGGGGSQITGTGTSRILGKYAFDAETVRLVYGNWDESSTADGLPPGPITIKAGFEPVLNGTIYPVTFSGRRTVTIDTGYIVSDPISVRVLAGQTWAARTYLSSGSPWANVATQGDGDGWTATTDLTDPGSAAPAADNNLWRYAPIGVLAQPRSGKQTANVGIVGDSIGRGTGDFGYTTYNGGFIVRALAPSGTPTVGYLQTAVPSASTTTWDNGHFYRLPLLEDCTDIVCQLGVNTVKSSDTTATLQTTLLSIWRSVTATGAKGWQTTITPVSSSTDSWATVGNQTANSNDAVRIAVNNWLRDGAPVNTSGNAVAVGTSGAARCAYYQNGTLVTAASGPAHTLAGVFEVADLVESARNSGKWKADLTGDGTHPNTAGHVAMVPGVNAALFTG